MGRGFVEYTLSASNNSEWVLYSAFFRYRIDASTTLTIDQSPVWCSECDRFALGEVVPTVEELRERISKIESADPDTMRVLEFCDQSPVDAVTELRIRIAWRQMRQSPPRCLHCGTVEITPIPIQGEFVHPQTGERVVVASSGWSDAGPEYAEYDIEGCRLDTERRSR